MPRRTHRFQIGAARPCVPSKMQATWLAVTATVTVVAAGGEGQWQLDDACVVWDGAGRGSPGVPAFFSRLSRRRLIPSPLFYTERGHVWVRPGESTAVLDAGGDGDAGCRVDSRTAFVAMLSNPANLFHAMHHAVPIAEALNGGSLPLAFTRTRTPMVLLPWANDLAADEIAMHPNRRGVSPQLKDWVSGPRALYPNTARGPGRGPRAVCHLPMTCVMLMLCLINA